MTTKSSEPQTKRSLTTQLKETFRRSAIAFFTYILVVFLLGTLLSFLSSSDPFKLSMNDYIDAGWKALIATIMYIGGLVFSTACNVAPWLPWCGSGSSNGNLTLILVGLAASAAAIWSFFSLISLFGLLISIFKEIRELTISDIIETFRNIITKDDHKI